MSTPDDGLTVDTSTVDTSTRGAEVAGAGADVVVVGGGLAGITAALRCADAGRRVVLLEGRPKLGGLTHSFRRDVPGVAPGATLSVDNGQHVFLRCCTAYLELLDRLGVGDGVQQQPGLRIPIRSPRGAHVLTRTDAPPPLHLAPSLLRYGLMPLADRLRAGRAILALKALDRDDPAADRQSFASWLTRHGQSERGIDMLWDLITVPTLNAPASEASLALAATVFQLGLLTDAGASDIGWSTWPLQRLHGDAATAALSAAGVEVRLTTRVESLDRTAHGWRVGLRDAGPLQTADVIVATPPDVTERLVEPELIGQRPGWSQRLGSAPIVNVHLVLDRRVLDEPFLATVDSPVQWVFDRSESSGLAAVRASAQYLAVSLSAADEWIDVPAARVVDTIVPALARVLPGVSDASVLRSLVLEAFVTRERHATFRPAPGAAQWRPAPVTHTRGLTLAGAWTATGWPATMEGAVRSGTTAADAVLGSTSPGSGERATAA